ncbi:Zn2-C6 fungal-type domain-containing protein [Fusarium acuminatum]|uniref:Zn2-C6 fungal-type domain-containing protein n=1 Tax=Fusarium acuminatum TaxID=5515 RepID=A0ABZ2WMF2_9HYPO
MPQCGRCKTQKLACVYPVRAKRRSARPLIDPALSADGPNAALSTILDRLQRLEAQGTAGSSSISGQSMPTPGGDGSEISSSPVTSNTTNGHGSSALTHHNPVREMDAMTVLKDAVDHVQELTKRTFGTAAITRSLDIPTDLAKAWATNFFEHMPACMFISLVDRRIIEMLPDIINLPYIHVDPVILVIYYSVIYHGCCLKASNITSTDGLGYMNSSFLGCLRALPSWEREASGTMTDLIAALFTSRMAAEFFDYDLAWRTFKLACQYCQDLNLHKLDSDENDTFFSEAKCDEERRGFWEVIQIDLFYRLILNTPPIEWIEAAQDNEQDIWVVSDVILTGYTSIIYMFRKMALLDSNSPRPPTTDLDIPDSPIVEDAARRLIATLNRLLVLYPYGVTMTGLFGAYRCFVAFAYLANTILRAEDPRRYMADVEALERLSNQSTFLCRGNRDVMPLVKAMQSITEEIRKKLDKHS